MRWSLPLQAAFKMIINPQYSQCMRCMALTWTSVGWQWCPFVNEIFVDCSSSSNFISRRIQQNTFNMRNIPTIISQMYSSGGCQRSSETHRADNPLFNNNTAGGRQVAKGHILLFSDVSSTLYYQNEWFNISGSDLLIVSWYNVEHISMISWQ